MHFIRDEKRMAVWLLFDCNSHQLLQPIVRDVGSCIRTCREQQITLLLLYMGGGSDAEIYCSVGAVGSLMSVP